MRSREEVEIEIKKLKRFARAFDTEEQTDNTILAVGAHDALRWALELANESISDNLERE